VWYAEQMDALVDRCAAFVARNLVAIIKRPTDMLTLAPELFRLIVKVGPVATFAARRRRRALLAACRRCSHCYWWYNSCLLGCVLAASPEHVPARVDQQPARYIARLASAAAAAAAAARKMLRPAPTQLPTCAACCCRRPQALSDEEMEALHEAGDSGAGDAAPW
jgi:hypothetical protein